jgi:hypothetical protein
MFTIPYEDLPDFMKKDKNPKPSYYIFAKDAEGNNQRIGAAFAHKKGKGLSIVINGQRYAAFPPKKNNEA